MHLVVLCLTMLLGQTRLLLPISAVPKTPQPSLGLPGPGEVQEVPEYE